MGRIKAVFTAIFEPRHKSKCKSEIEAFGAAGFFLLIKNACDGDLNATKESEARLRANMTIANATRYSETLTGAGYEW